MRIAGGVAGHERCRPVLKCDRHVQDHRAVDNLIKQFREDAAVASAETVPDTTNEDQGGESKPTNQGPEPSIFYNQDLEACDDIPDEAASLFLVSGTACHTQVTFPGSGGSQVYFLHSEKTIQMHL